MSFDTRQRGVRDVAFQVSVIKRLSQTKSSQFAQIRSAFGVQLMKKRVLCHVILPAP